jgi:hypothetical protein
MPAFVELIAPQTAVAPTCIIELDGQRGTLRIEWKGTTTDLATFQSRIVGDDRLIQITPQLRILVAIEGNARGSVESNDSRVIHSTTPFSP